MAEKVLDFIKQYSDMNKLSVFVGAGVSKLSDYPSWGELVKSMAVEINYNDINNKENEMVFSQEEYLKIPQMYYIEYGEDNYKAFVKSKFSNSCVPN